MKWTQEQAIAFESARECITALMSILTAQLADEEALHGPESPRAKVINDRITVLFKERAALLPTDVDAVGRARREYGAEVRAAIEAERARHPELQAA